jgi:hypothetical protein
MNDFALVSKMKSLSARTPHCVKHIQIAAEHCEVMIRGGKQSLPFCRGSSPNLLSFQKSVDYSNFSNHVHFFRSAQEPRCPN